MAPSKENVKFQNFENITTNKHGNQLLAASASSSILPRVGYDKAFYEYLGVSIAFLYVARVQPWLIIHTPWKMTQTSPSCQRIKEERQ